MARIILNKLSKVYENGFKAVHDIDLEINDGEFMVFVGPSGCAKSTLIRMIAGIERISSGSLSIGDEVVNFVPASKRGIAMVFQDYAMFPLMSVFENIAVGLKAAKLKKSELQQRVVEAAKMLEIEHLLEQTPRTLSGGQKQRVAVARAVAKKAQVMLFDEPLSNLDAKLRTAVRKQIAELHQRLNQAEHKATMIYVTHDQVEAMTLGDRVCVLNRGEIMQVDTPLNLYNYPKNIFVAGFIGSPLINFFPAELWQNSAQLVLGLVGKEFSLPPEKEQALRQNIAQLASAKHPVLVGLRPEHLSIVLPDKDSEHTHLAYLRGKIEFIENLGNCAYCHFTLANSPTIYIAQLPEELVQRRGLLLGQEYLFQLELDYCHIFDYTTELNLSLPLK